MSCGEEWLFVNSGKHSQSRREHLPATNHRIHGQNHLTKANTKTAYANIPVTKMGI